ncbi:MAG: hypothetical protein N4A48_09790 [Tepidibacter sp.]|jgi:hypothetical protein|uniref:hypothetical protein n=1 Tax=Tepidibacter sp. TaxID=2529387 RepID=UPI0025F2C28E|nr:hypothetical protein [Tepidibacter sp.]MCT4509032.1 hypothetical protein [Tepidibacter sp.]
MINQINKEEVLQDFIKDHVYQRWQYELNEIDKRYKQDKEKIENELISAFELACKKSLNLQNKGEKGDIKYIYISFLRTSIIENKSFYRIETYDENWFLDKKECFSLWNSDFIFTSLFNHMKDLEQKKVDYFSKITSMDIDRIKFLESTKYHVLAVEFIKNLIFNFLENSKYKEMDKTNDICILAGEYMDQSEILYKENGGE